MKGQDYFTKYLRWVETNTMYQMLSDYTEIINTPFLDPHNDSIQIFIKELDDKTYRISDGGNTLEGLALYGIDFQPKTYRTDLFQSILNSFYVATESGELVTYASSEDIEMKQHFLLQAIFQIQEMYILAQPGYVDTFKQDVTNLLTRQNIDFRSDAKYIGQTGYEYCFDFELNEKLSRNRILHLLPKANRKKTIQLLFGWEDIRTSQSKDIDLFVITNEQDDINSRKTTEKALERKGAVVLPWEDKDNWISAIA